MNGKRRAVIVWSIKLATSRKIAVQQCTEGWWNRCSAVFAQELVRPRLTNSLCGITLRWKERFWQSCRSSVLDEDLAAQKWRSLSEEHLCSGSKVSTSVLRSFLTRSRRSQNDELVCYKATLLQRHRVLLWNISVSTLRKKENCFFRLLHVSNYLLQVYTFQFRFRHL